MMKKLNSKGQGTIEYLVIIAIVVVISLVVVALLLGIFDNNTSGVSEKTSIIQAQTMPVALNEAILGTGTDANGLIVLSNNTGSIITSIRIRIDGKDHNYYQVNLPTGSELVFKLTDISVSCQPNETSILKDIEIYYMLQNGLEKKQVIEGIKLNCAQTGNPQSSKTPFEENLERIPITFCKDSGWLSNKHYTTNRNFTTSTASGASGASGQSPNEATNIFTSCFTVNDSSLNNVIIDCRNNIITGNGSWTGAIIKGAKNITIQNCELRDFGSGITSSDGTSVTLINTTVRSIYCTNESQ